MLAHFYCPLPLVSHCIQPHVAVEGSPVIQKYLESLTQGDVKVSLSGFQRWTLGQSQ